VVPAVRGDFYAAVTQRLDAQDSELLNLELEMEAAAVAAAQAAATAKQQQQQQQQQPIGARSAAPRSPAVSPIAPRSVQQQQQQQQQLRSSPQRLQQAVMQVHSSAPTAAAVVIAGLAAAPPPSLPAQTHASVVRRSPARTAAAVVAGNGRHKGALPLASPPAADADSSTATTTAATTAGDDNTTAVAVLNKGDSKSNGSSVIRMRGLPYRASKAEVTAFFKGCVVADEGVIFVARPDGKATGEAYVHFASRDDMRTALRRDREMLGNRYIELFASSAEEVQRHCKAAAR
jgi:RNA recognition motif. (a.k.a. RRM, RBD, or RNP domain)